MNPRTFTRRSGFNSAQGTHKGRQPKESGRFWGRLISSCEKDTTETATKKADPQAASGAAREKTPRIAPGGPVYATGSTDLRPRQSKGKQGEISLGWNPGPGPQTISSKSQIQRILVPVDAIHTKLSDISPILLMPRRLGATVTLLHCYVAPPSFDFAVGDAALANYLDRVGPKKLAEPILAGKNSGTV